MFIRAKNVKYFLLGANKGLYNDFQWPNAVIHDSWPMDAVYKSPYILRDKYDLAILYLPEVDRRETKTIPSYR